jgi:hypothetical protein
MAIDLQAKLQQSKLYFANLMDKYVDSYVFGISSDDCTSNKTEYAYFLIEAIEYQMEKGLGIDDPTTLEIYKKLDCITPINNTPVTIDESLLTPISNNPITGLVVYFNDILGSPYDNDALLAVLNSKFNNPTGTTAQYLRGDGSLATLPAQVFTVDIPVSLSSGKTLGKYVSGQTVPAIGKTAQQVFLDIAIEALNPTVTLTSSTTIAFNQTAISNVLNFSYVINSLGAMVSTATLQWRRNNTGAWTTLSSSTTTPSSFTHTLTDTAFNTQPFNYQYIVTDTAGGTATATLNITPAAYAAPTIPISVIGTISAPQTQSLREVGNVNSTVSSTSISVNSPLVPLVSGVLEYYNGSAWVGVTAETSLSGSSGNIPSFLHTSAPASSTSIQYRVRVTDIYATNYSVTYTITLRFLYLYGYIATATPSAVQLYAIGNGALQSVIARTLTSVTANAGFYTYIASPTTLPAISNIIQDGATPVLGAFTASVVTLTNQYSIAQSYNILKSNADQAFTNNTLVIS